MFGEENNRWMLVTLLYLLDYGIDIGIGSLVFSGIIILIRYWWIPIIKDA